MTFDWFRRRRRRLILEQPFPSAWSGFLRAHIGRYRNLNDEQRSRLHRLVQVFVAEKHWEGAGGLSMNDEIKVVIAGQACLLVMGLEHDLYRRVQSIVVYPSTVCIPARKISFFEVPTAPLERGRRLVGQAWTQGLVILVWDAVQEGAADAYDGDNVVFHEFAHALDMFDGRADGVPPLGNRRAFARWAEVFERHWDQLNTALDAGQDTFLDEYASKDPAEFFAVATEQFFEQGRAMELEHPELYEVLRSFYRQDPARWGSLGLF